MKVIRTLLLTIILGAMVGLFAVARAQEPAVAPLSFGITPVFLVDQNPFLAHWKDYLESRLHRPVRFVRRKSYAEISDMLLNGQLDVAWLCSYSFAVYSNRLVPLATPLFRGEPYYRSYLIVSAEDSAVRGYLDLAEKVFAYVEPRSNTGFIVPRETLRRLGRDPDHFFRTTFFTWSHADVIAAVADRVADAGAVDSYIWEILARRQPAMAAKTRVVEKSEAYGFPPIVAGPQFPAADLGRLRALLMNMHEDEEGRRLLAMVELDRLGPVDRAWYQNIPLPVMPVVQRTAPSPDDF
ncbi:MAG: PhnD/SsuA/transferrin family substrate-binding protein [Magnetococcus sp. WYHC-3]